MAYIVLIFSLILPRTNQQGHINIVIPYGHINIVTPYFHINIFMPYYGHINIAIPYGHINIVIPYDHINIVIPYGHINIVIPYGHINIFIPYGHINIVIPYGHINIFMSYYGHINIACPKMWYTSRSKSYKTIIIRCPKERGVFTVADLKLHSKQLLSKPSTGQCSYWSHRLLILYSGKVWQVESLANLANILRFTKLEPSKVAVTISDPLADLFIHQSLFHQILENNKFAKHAPR